ncbi:MAG: 50S ribosomal protein L23 [Candidatus Zeuxoniibacter abyssi]|nr:MAG: 50S ribosomal protein L23 [Candidatus Persebacteraceae bacterium AB1(2)]
MSGHSRLMSIVTAPVVSEKSTEFADKRRTVVFRVLPDARKDEIKRAVEKMFEVKVEKVRVICVRGKAVSRMGHTGVRASWKKAYVRLAQGSDINFAELQ